MAQDCEVVVSGVTVSGFVDYILTAMTDREKRHVHFPSLISIL